MDQPKPNTRSNKRLSQPAGALNWQGDGIGFLPRRGIWQNRIAQLTTLEGVRWLAINAPNDLLSFLPGIVPEVGLAVWNFLRIACDPGVVRLVVRDVSGAETAVQEPTDTVGNDGNAQDAQSSEQEEDDEGSDDTDTPESAEGRLLIDQLFANLSDEVGGFDGALNQNMQMALYYGMSAVEFVPNAGRMGTGEIWPINPSTLDFQRDDDGYLFLLQRQTNTGKPTFSLGGNLVPLNMNRTFWRSLDPVPNNPYGLSPLAPALSEVLLNLTFMRDLALAWHRVGTPNMDVAFDWDHWTQYAKMFPNIVGDMDVQTFVNQKFHEAKQRMLTKDPDEVYFHGIHDKVNVVGSGGTWPDVPGIYGLFQKRLIIALKQLPVLMGVVDGTTETWSTTQWAIWTAGLASVTRVAVEPLRRAAELYLQNLGKQMKVEVVIKTPRSSARLAEAQAAALEIANAAESRDQGWLTQDEASMAVTGRPAAGPPPPVALPGTWTVDPKNAPDPADPATDPVPPDDNEGDTDPADKDGQTKTKTDTKSSAKRTAGVLRVRGTHHQRMAATVARIIAYEREGTVQNA